jgi:protein O-mannosyl-transferase
VASCAVWFYFGKLLWPLDLCFIYPRWNIDEGGISWYLPGLLLAIVFALAWRRRSSWGRPVVMLIVCYVGLLLPSLGLVNIYFMRFSLVSDHWQYAAAIVPCAALAGAAAVWTHRQPGARNVRLAAGVLGLSLLAALAGLTWRQSRIYADADMLWNDTLAKNPNCWMAHNNLGMALAARGQREEAIDHFRKVLQIKPDYFAAHLNLGQALIARGQLDDAAAHYRMALETEPDYLEAHYNLAAILAPRKQFEEAIVHYRRALEIKPDMIEARYNLAETYYNLGNDLAARRQFDEAIVNYLKALEIKPDLLEADYNLGNALAAQRKFNEAIVYYLRALEIKPEYADAHNNLGAALAGNGQIDEAIVHYLKALEIKPDLTGAHYNLANAFAARGQIDKALPHYQKALDLASAKDDRALADEIRAKMRLAGSGN